MPPTAIHIVRAQGKGTERSGFPSRARAGICRALVLLTCATAAKAQDSALVSKMAEKESAAHSQDLHYSYYAEETSARTGRHVWRQKDVETDLGTLHRLLAIDGTPLTSVQAKAEQARIQGLVRDPSSLKQENQAHLGDEAHAIELLRLLSKAFLVAPAGEQDGCTRLSFRPNPAFQPSNYEERVALSMEGTVSLRQPMDRLCLLNATIAHPVEFGFGFLGRVEQGGHFSLERVPADPDHWKSDHIIVHVQGRILMLKSLTRDQEIRRTNIKIIPQHMSLEQAAQLSSN